MQLDFIWFCILLLIVFSVIFSSLTPISTGSEAEYGHTCKGLSFFVVSNAGVLCVVMHKCSSPLTLWGGVWYNEAQPGGVPCRPSEF